MMRMFVAVLLAAGLTAPAYAQPADDDAADARCFLLTASLLDSSDDPDMQQAGLVASQYFLGRIDGRSPGTDLEALLLREAALLGEGEHGKLLLSCLSHIERRGSDLIAIGERIEAAE